jgi:hypothetical protein
MKLDDKGRCCDRKPLFYKRGWNNRGPHHFCPRCAREYTEAGEQRENFHWKEVAPGSFEKRRRYGIKVMESDVVPESALPADMTDDDRVEWGRYSKLHAGVTVGPVPFLL